MPPKYHKYLPSIMIIFGIIGTVLALGRWDILWISLGMISFVLMLGIRRVEDSYRLRWELIALLLIPLFLGMSGISSGLQNRLFGIDIAFVIFSPTLGFMIMFNLHHHTSLKVNFPFAIFFIVVFSLAAGALIGIGEFFSDVYFGTNFLESNFDLMIDLIIITIGGVIMGLFFKNYIEKSSYDSIQSMTSTLDIDPKRTANLAAYLLFSGFGEKGHRWAPIFSRVLQMTILVFAMYAIYVGNVRWFFSAILSFAVTMIPYLFTQNMNIVIPPLLNLWICIALFLHVLGGVRGYYDHVWWWDTLTHFISAALISILGYTILLTITRLSDSLYIPYTIIPIIILLFILATGVVWEIFEFFADQILGTNMQYSLEDTVYDMVLNTVGAIFASILGYRYFLPKYWRRRIRRS